MSMIDFATKLAALDAAIATATGADKTLGQEVRTKLAALGAKLTARYVGDVDAAKTAWSAKYTAAFNEAEEAAGYVFSETGAPAPSDIEVNLYDSAEISARLTAAQKLTGNAFLTRVLTTHRSALSVAFAGGSDEYTRRPTSVSLSAKGTPINVSTDVSVADIEREIHVLMRDEADPWLELAAFP